MPNVRFLGKFEQVLDGGGGGGYFTPHRPFSTSKRTPKKPTQIGFKIILT